MRKMWQENVCESICCHLPKPSLFPQDYVDPAEKHPAERCGRVPCSREVNQYSSGGPKWCNRV